MRLSGKAALLGGGEEKSGDVRLSGKAALLSGGEEKSGDVRLSGFPPPAHGDVNLCSEPVCPSIMYK